MSRREKWLTMLATAVAGGCFDVVDPPQPTPRPPSPAFFRVQVGWPVAGDSVDIMVIAEPGTLTDSSLRIAHFPVEFSLPDGTVLPATEDAFGHAAWGLRLHARSLPPGEVFRFGAPAIEGIEWCRDTLWTPPRVFSADTMLTLASGQDLRVPIPYPQSAGGSLRWDFDVLGIGSIASRISFRGIEVALPETLVVSAAELDRLGADTLMASLSISESFVCGAPAAEPTSIMSATSHSFSRLRIIRAPRLP